MSFVAAYSFGIPVKILSIETSVCANIAYPDQTARSSLIGVTLFDVRSASFGRITAL